MHYTGTIWRPPYEADSLLLEVTAGCTHHSCKFCTLYEDLPFAFRMSPLADVESDLREVQLLCHAPDAALAGQLFGMPRPAAIRRTFLTGANPFVLKAERLLQISALIRKYVPTNQTIGCFARITDIALKTDAELLALRRAGYDGLTIGMETADDTALTFMRKGYLAADILTQCQRLDRAGIGYSFFYLVGISGRGHGTESAARTAEVCNQLRPRLIGANMLTIYPTSELYREIQRSAWTEETEVEKYQEMRTLVEGLSIPTVFAAMGASNAFQLRGALPQDKGQLLEEIDCILHEVGEERLRGYRTSLRHL